MIRRPSNANWRRRVELRLLKLGNSDIEPEEATMTVKTKSRFLLAACAVLAMGASPLPASADSIPGMRGHDHTGITVPDVKAATAFFTDVIGCSHAMSFGPFSDDKGTFMQDVVDVNPRAVIDEISMVRCGYGSNIELFQYQAPDQAKTLPKNSDIGGHHIALYVDDIDKAAAYLKEKDVRTLQGPIPIKEGPAAGQSILYFFAPWGLQMELISYPKGMAYEKDAKTVLWMTTEPMK
jgi:catechol 2,3-dioxygenase-like lactoylglutathione lyase family enzyme